MWNMHAHVHTRSLKLSSTYTHAHTTQPYSWQQVDCRSMQFCVVASEGVCVCDWGFNGVNDWWSTLDSEQSQVEIVQMETIQSACRGPEFAQSLDDYEAPYITVRKGLLQHNAMSLWVPQCDQRTRPCHRAPKELVPLPKQKEVYF